MFHTGSIATAWGVYHDETMSKLLKNVLYHFEVEAKSKRAAGGLVTFVSAMT